MSKPSEALSKTVLAFLSEKMSEKFEIENDNYKIVFVGGFALVSKDNYKNYSQENGIKVYIEQGGNKSDIVISGDSAKVFVNELEVAIEANDPEIIQQKAVIAAIIEETKEAEIKIAVDKTLVEAAKKIQEANDKNDPEEKMVLILKLSAADGDFNEQLSGAAGFGFQDLKPVHQDTFVALTTAYKRKIAVLPIGQPTSLANAELGIYYTK